jgi:glutamyl-tRNA synthetase
MDPELRERVEEAAEKHALYNAVKHESDAEVGAVVGPLMGENPDFRQHGEEIPGIVAPVVSTVNDLSPVERRERLADLAPDLLAELDAEDDETEHLLPDLPGAEAYDEVRMRLAPNPNGPWHLGSARMPAVIGTYTERYDGWMLCRFDDTDPETKRPDPDAYDAILDSIAHLGFEPDEVIRASDRLPTYYEHARELIEAGGAYTCQCPGEHFSELKNDGRACEHRDKGSEESLAEFEAMVDGEHSAGDIVLRVRTDIEHRNPALRDWVAFRMVDTPHPREEAAEYRCWPMLDFQSGIDDHLTGITHIIRGIDLQDSAKRQRFLYEYFGWEYPETIHWGHVGVDAYDVPLSTSSIKTRIEAGDLEGWDDPRAPTLASLRRRGIRGEAVVSAMVELGTSTSNVDLSMDSIYAANRELIDDDADRLFFVRDPIEKPVLMGPETGEPPVHPDHEERGHRTLRVGGAVLIEPADVPPNGKRVWLKGYGPVRHTRDAFEFTGEDIEVVREEDVDVIHWVPADDNRQLRLRTPDGDEEGYAEAGVVDYESGDVIQFERVGFARIDAHEADTKIDAHEADANDDEAKTVAYFAHQ